jgi:hypothetical protein
MKKYACLGIEMDPNYNASELIHSKKGDRKVRCNLPSYEKRLPAGGYYLTN